MGKVVVAACLIAALAGAAPLRAAPPTPLPDGVEPEDLEWVEMVAAILTGNLGPGEGWFHPSQSRYGWQWLADKHGVGPQGEITRDAFRGPPALFARLDRRGKGVLRAADFDWSPPPRKGSPSSAGMPDRLILLRGLLAGELGSPAPGPKLGRMAPDFTLPTPDGKQRVRLSDFRNRKPVVLIFGSFT